MMNLLYRYRHIAALHMSACAVCWCSTPGVFMTVNGKKALNMVSSNFLGVAGDPKIQASMNKLDSMIT